MNTKNHRRHPDESQDPELSSAALVTLGPGLRRDDGGVVSRDVTPDLFRGPLSLPRALAGQWMPERARHDGDG
jgi:hypothetical protein